MMMQISCHFLNSSRCNMLNATTPSWWNRELKCIWQIFFICSIKSPQSADKCSKKKLSIAIFLPRVLMCQKRQISLPVGYKTATPKQETRNDCDVNSGLQASQKQISQSFSYFEQINLLRNGTIVRCLWENKKTSEKSVFGEAWSPELTSQSTSVPCFWSRGFCTPPEVKFDVFGTSKHGKGKSLWKKLVCCTYQYTGEIWSSK